MKRGRHVSKFLKREKPKTADTAVRVRNAFCLALGERLLEEDEEVVAFRLLEEDDEVLPFRLLEEDEEVLAFLDNAEEAAETFFLFGAASLEPMASKLGSRCSRSG